MYHNQKLTTGVKRNSRIPNGEKGKNKTDAQTNIQACAHYVSEPKLTVVALRLETQKATMKIVRNITSLHFSDCA